MGSIPFSLYDLFAYLSAGALYLVTLDYVAGTGLMMTKDMPLAAQAFWIIAAYVLGHVNAHGASWLLEHHAVGALKKPSTHLFAEAKKGRFKAYRQPFPSDTAEAILEKYKRMSGKDKPGEAMFLFCYHLVKEKCPQAYARLNTFLSLYGFARNLSFATLALAVFLAGTAWVRQTPHLWQLAGIAAALSLVLFFRYLKFLRLFSIEVFTSFLVAIEEPKG